MGGREEPWCSTGVTQNKARRWMHWKLVFTQRAQFKAFCWYENTATENTPPHGAASGERTSPRLKHPALRCFPSLTEIRSSETEAVCYNTPRCQVTSYRDAELLAASVRNKEVHMTQVPQNPPLFLVSVMASADSAPMYSSSSTGDILTFPTPTSKWLYKAWRLLLTALIWNSTKYRNCPSCLTNSWVKQTFCGQLWNTSTITKYS